ncbi:MAG TPA: DUF1553 domain-containing protein [Pontiella sp.]
MNSRWFVLIVLAGLSFGPDVRSDPKQSSSEIDRLVFSKLEELNIPKSEPCSDEVFLRRVYLDMIGTLPTRTEVRDFLSSRSVDKREKLIEHLFERPEFADYWSLKWCDLLRVKAEFPSKLWPNAVQAYHRWIRTSLENNMPYDQFAGTLLSSSGSNFREAPVNFYRAMPKRDPEDIARIVALTFMGMRSDRWERSQVMGMAAFFGQISYKGTSEWKEEIVFYDPSKKFNNPDTGEPVDTWLPDGTSIEIQPGRDPRSDFADWLVRTDIFAENIVNRIWYWLLGRGIIHEADDIRPDNPPQNWELLDFLARELAEHDYDLRHIYRIILNSKTYQLSSIHNDGNRTDIVNFSHYQVRRLDAEVLMDAICQITETTEAYSSDIPEPFTFIPETQRSIKLADGSITSPFLDLFGRPPRDSGYESERNNTPSAAQKLHMLNSSHIQKKLLNNRELLGQVRDRGKKQKKAVRWKEPQQAAEDMYLTILSRYPTPYEMQLVLDYIQESETQISAAIDIVWALLNTKEFIYRH